MRTLKNLNTGTLIGCVVFLIVGLIALVAGTLMFTSNQRFKNNANEIMAVITDIEAYKNKEGETSHNVYVAFSLDGVVYEGKINEYSGGMYVGEEIYVFYNIDDPRDFRTANPLFPMVLLLCGILFLLIGSYPWIFAGLQNAAIKRFNQNHDWYENHNRYTPKSKMLADAAAVLNKPGQPWAVKVEGNTIIAHWRYKKAGSVGEDAINHFSYSVTLNDLGRWWEDLDNIETTSNVIGKRSGNYGKTYQKSIEFSIGKDKQSGKVALNKSASMDTGTIKKTIRTYLTNNGWKKAGLFIK